MFGPADEVVKGIPPPANHYDLAFQVLNERSNKLQLVATALLEKLCIALIQHESLGDLSNFVSMFDESVSLLTFFDIPDLGSFILFLLASRSFRVGIRKLFEVEYSDNYLSFNDLTQFHKSKVSILDMLRRVVNTSTFVKRLTIVRYVQNNNKK